MDIVRAYNSIDVNIYLTVAYVSGSHGNLNRYSNSEGELSFGSSIRRNPLAKNIRNIISFV